MKDLMIKEAMVIFAVALGFIGSLITIVAFIKSSAKDVRDDTDKRLRDYKDDILLARKTIDSRAERIDSMLTSLVTKEMCGFTVGHIRGELREIKAQNIMLQDVVKLINSDIREQNKDIKEILKRMPK